MSNQEYFGAYMGKDSMMGYTVSVYKADKTSGHFVRMMGGYYIVNTGTHAAEGDTLTARMRPLLKADGEAVRKAKIVSYEEILFDNSGTRSDDYPEYRRPADLKVWESVDFCADVNAVLSAGEKNGARIFLGSLKVNKEGRVLSQDISAELDRIFNGGKQEVDDKLKEEQERKRQKAAAEAPRKEVPPEFIDVEPDDDGDEDGDDGKDESGEGGQGKDGSGGKGGGRKPGEGKGGGKGTGGGPEPEKGTGCGQRGEGPEGGIILDPPAGELPKGGGRRGKEDGSGGQSGDGSGSGGNVGNDETCGGFGIEGGKGNPPPQAGRKRKPIPYLYVFGTCRQKLMNDGYTVNIYNFAGITMRGAARVLPSFVTYKTGGEVPWQAMLKKLSQYALSIEIFYFQDYDKVVEKYLAGFFPKAKFYKAFYELPQDAPARKRAEEVNREFDKEVKNFWMMRFNGENTGKLARTMLELINHLRDYFLKYIYKTEFILKEPQKEEPQAKPEPAPLAAETAVAAAEKTEASPVTQSAPVHSPAANTQSAPAQASAPTPIEKFVYCCILEKMYHDNGEYKKILVFSKMAEGRIEKIILIPAQYALNNDVWESAVSKAAAKFGKIKYLLPRQCSLNLWTVNKGILPDTVWCGSIADIYYKEDFRAENLSKFGEIEGLLAGSGMNPESMKECLGKTGVTEIEII